MKKLWILFTALALLAVALPAVAEVTTGAVFYWYGITDLADGANSDASLLKARIKVAGDLDEFNKISTELRWNNGGNTWDPAAVKIKTFKLDTDITGALGLDLPLTVKATAGVWESDFTGWWYATRAGYTFVGGFNQDEQAKGAGQLDIGIGPANLHYYQNFNFDTTMVGADVAFGPAGVWVAYKANPMTFADGEVNVEAKYEGTFGDLGLSVYPGVGLNLASGNFSWDAGVKAAYKMITAAVSANGNSHHAAFDKLEAELGLAAGDAAFWVAGYMSFWSGDAFQGLDLMGSYKLGASTLYLGYVIVPDTSAGGIPIDGWEWDTGTGGLYLGLKASF